jgi:hypothetical protein
VTVREVGLVAIGFALGVSLTGAWLAYAVSDLKRTDSITRAIALRYHGPRVQGEG